MRSTVPHRRPVAFGTCFGAFPPQRLLRRSGSTCALDHNGLRKQMQLAKSDTVLNVNIALGDYSVKSRIYNRLRQR